MSSDNKRVNNGQVELIVDRKNLSGRIIGVRPKQSWRFNAGRHLAGVLDGSQYAAEVISHRDIARGAGGVEQDVRIGPNTYRAAVWLSDSGLDVFFELTPLEEAAEITDVSFPGPLVPEDDWISSVTVPVMLTNGIVHRPEREDEWDYRCGVATHSGLNMPFWGESSNAGDVLVILETPDDVTLCFEKQADQPIRVHPRWAASMGTMRYPRRLKVSPLGGGYVAQAKAYRAYVKAAGRFKSLAEKVGERPAAKQVVGGPYFSLGYLPYSERKFRQVLAGLRAIGYTHGVIGPVYHVQWDSGAWLNDYQPFVMSPQYAAIAREYGFAAFSWFYLEDILTWDRYFDENWLVKKPDGTLEEGWFNRDYSYYHICSRVLKDKQKLMAEDSKPFDALHFDTTTAHYLTECWDPNHRMTRSQDRESRHARFEEATSWGKTIGSEAGYDWAFDVYDWCSSNPRRGLETGFPARAEHVPLLGLVYHDSVVSYCWEYDPYPQSYFGGNWATDKMLYDAMAGNPPTLAPIFGYFPVIRRPAPSPEARWVLWEDDENQRILRDALPIAKLHEKTAAYEMADHVYEGERRTLSITTYADGSIALVNFDERPQHTHSGIEVAGKNYRIISK